jgi:aryl-alcohol dehydrogenase
VSAATDTVATRAAVATGPNLPFELRTLTLDAPRADEVLVRVAGVGICHTDLIARDQILPVGLPAVLGHEASGVVERVGAEVTDLAVGDHVVLTYLSCGTCWRCLHGEPAYCERMPMLNYLGKRADGSVALHDGDAPVGSHFFGQSSFATYALAPRRSVVKVSSDLPLELLGPLGCGIQTGAGAVLNVIAPTPGSSIAIFGGGAVGLSAVLAARSADCARVAVVDPKPERREAALEFGATHVFDPMVDGFAEALVQDGAFDASLDTSGVPASIAAAVACLRVRGVCALVGSSSVVGQTFPVRTGLFVQRGITLRGVIEGDGDPQTFIPHLLALQAAGRFPFERLIARYPLEDINRAIDDQHAGRCVKPVLVTGGGTPSAATH